ncbi:hypothetical protein, partial [Aquabacterium sp.]|uniref:hypothetical protein n=1 Tax=Aquabacterium sp. TaxID=1872578 RepID=UPI0025BC5AEC
MPKLLCKLLNASELISGVKFVTHQDGMLSEEVSDEVAATFTEIPGYEIAVPVQTVAVTVVTPAAAEPAA